MTEKYLDTDTERIVQFPTTEGPGFLVSMFVELEKGGNIAIASFNQKGDPYVYSRITKKDFLAAVQIITGNI